MNEPFCRLLPVIAGFCGLLRVIEAYYGFLREYQRAELAPGIFFSCFLIPTPLFWVDSTPFLARPRLQYLHTDG